MKKSRVAFICLTSLLAIGLAACGTTEELDKAEALNNSIANVLKEKRGISEFNMISADFESTAFSYSIDINGIARKDGEVGYAYLSYEVPMEDIMNLKYGDRYEVLKHVVENSHAKDIEYVTVFDISKVNSNLSKNVPSPFENCKVSGSLLCGVTTSLYNDETKEISFKAKTLVEVIESRVNQEGYEKAIGFSGNYSYTTGKNGFYTVEDEYKIVITDEQKTLLDNNSTTIYDIAAQAILDGNVAVVSANRVNVSAVTNEDINNMTQFANHDLLR